MTRYLLDTDTVSFVMRKYDQRLVDRFLRTPKGDWAISSITYAELLFGIEPLSALSPARLRFNDFIRDANILDRPAHAAGHHAEIRYRTRNQPLNHCDIFIAAHAIALDSILITNNTRHFSRMAGGLRYENWIDSPPVTQAFTK